MDIEELRTFVEVADAGGVSPAARRLGVSKSIGLFFLYYVLMNFASVLATKGIVEPEIAAWMPNAGMLALAVWFFARLR